MKANCTLIPNAPNGLQSKLFADLLEYLNNRENAVYIYALSRTNLISKDKLEFDENSEPTLASLSKSIDINKLVDESFILTDDKRKLGATDNSNNIIYHNNINDILNKVLTYNRDNPDNVATILLVNNKYIINVEKRDISNIDEGNELNFKSALNNRLLGIMRNLGFNIEISEDLLTRGIFNPLYANNTAEALKTVIKVAKGEEGEQSFPEEFSHFIIAGLKLLPLVSRVLNILRDANLQELVLGDSYLIYKEKYSNDINRLAEEAAGKILADKIKNRDIPSGTLDTLLSRLWNYIKNIFKKLSTNIIDVSIQEVNLSFERLADLVLSTDIAPIFSISSLVDSKPLYNLSNKTDKLKELSLLALMLASKRLLIETSRTKSGEYNKLDSKAIKEIQKLILKNKYEDSLLSFLESSLNSIKGMNDLLIESLKLYRDSTDLVKISKVTKLLRNLLDFFDGYSPILKQLSAVETLKLLGDLNIDDTKAVEIRDLARSINTIVEELKVSHRKLRFDVLLNFWKIYWGEDKIISLGKNKGDKLTLEYILKMADKDIGFLDRWINSMSDASDPILSLMAKSVKLTHIERDNILLNYLTAIRAAHTKLTDAGFTTDFMFERDEDGVPTGKIISDIDYNKFLKLRKDYYNSLKSLPFLRRKAKMEVWDRLHTEDVILDSDTGRKERLPSKDLYFKDNLSKLSPVLREYYDAMIKLKSALDSKIPTKYSRLYDAIQIRNDVIEATYNNISNPKEAAKLYLSNLKDKFVMRSDDNEYGDLFSEDFKTVKTDISGKNVLKTIPIYYTRRLEDMRRLSTDFTASISAYAAMAINYNEMSKIVDALELTKTLLKDREVLLLSGNSKLVDTFKVLNKIFTKAYTLSGDATKIIARVEDFLDALVYGRHKKLEGTFNILGEEVSVSKLLDNIKSYSGLVGLGLNTFSALNNVLLGKMLIFIEAVGGEYFNLKDSVIGKKNYYQLLPMYLSLINSVTKTNKLGLLIEKFDALQEFYNDMHRRNYYNSALSRVIGLGSFYVLNNLGEHYLHSRTMLSMLNHYKVKDKSGLEISLFDAFKVEKILDDENKVIGATLKLQDGVTNIDGTLITEDQIKLLKLRIGKVNQSLNGAFNEDDKGAIQRYALGRLAMLFRLWMPEHYNRRFKKSLYNAELDLYREGFYRTFGRFSYELLRDLTRALFEVATRWNELNPHERANIRRATAEIGAFLMLSLLVSLLGPITDKKGNWAERMALYQLNRLKLEVGASVPSIGFLDNIGKLTLSPIAAVNLFNNLTNVLKVWNISEELKSGAYKGWTRYERDLVKTMPVYGQIRRLFDLGLEDYMFTIFNN